MRIHLTGWAVIALAIIGSGCSRSPRVNFYTLSPGAVPQAAGAATTDTALVVGPVTLPELVDRPQLVVRLAENRVEVLESHRWAEPLKSEIPRLMARQLGGMLGSSRVSSYGQSAGQEAKYRVLVDIVRLESVPGDSVTIEALWTVRGFGAARRGGRTLITEKAAGAGYDALVAACSRALAGISADIAKAVNAGGLESP